MAKKTGENQDYYKTAGQSSGRRILAGERRKVSEARAGELGGEMPPPLKKPAVKAAGAGTQTAQILGRRRARKEAQQQAEQLGRQAEEVERDEVQRMVDSQAPAAPPERMLPPARATTELNDLWRSVQEEARTVRGSAHTLYQAGQEMVRSIGALLRTPARLVRVLRTAGA